MNINKKCLQHFEKTIGICFTQNCEEFKYYCQVCLQDNKSVYNLYKNDCYEFYVIETKLQEQYSFLKYITYLTQIMGIQWKEIKQHQSNYSIIKNQYSFDILTKIEIFLQGLEYELNRLSKIQRYFIINPFLCLTKYQQQLMTICNNQKEPKISLEIESFYFLLIDLIEGFSYNFNFDNLINELNFIALKLKKQQNEQGLILNTKADLIITFKYLLQTFKKKNKYLKIYFNDGNQIGNEDIKQEADEKLFSQIKILKFELQYKNQNTDQNQFESIYENEYFKQDEIMQFVEKIKNQCIQLCQQKKFSEANYCLDEALDLINLKIDRNQNAQDEMEQLQNTQCFQQGRNNFQFQSTIDQQQMQIKIEQTEVHPENNKISYIYILKGRILNQMKKHEEALNYYNKAIHFNKLISQAYEEKGVTLIYQRNYIEALDCFKYYLELIQVKGITTQIDDYYQMVSKQFRFNNHDDMILNFNSLTSLIIEQVKQYEQNIEPQTIKQKILKTVIIIGNLCLKIRDAIQYYDKAIEIDPNNANAFNKKGQILMLQHRYKNALKEFDLILYINNQYIPAYINKAQTLILQQNYYEALKCLYISLQLDKSQVLNYYFLGIVYYQKYLQQYQKKFLLSAMDQFEILISLINDNDQIEIYDGFNNKDKIILILDNQIADSQIILINAYSKRGEILLQQRKINDFMQNYEEAFQICSDQQRHLMLFTNKAQTLVKNKYNLQAILCIDQGIRTFSLNNDTISVKKFLEYKSQILAQQHLFREQVLVQRLFQNVISKNLMRQI